MKVGARLILFTLVSVVWAARLVAVTNLVETAAVTLSPEERDWIARHPVLRVGVLTNWAPFSYIGSDGKLTGIDSDLLHLMSQRTGLKFQLVPQKNWGTLVSNWNQLDMVSSIAQSPLREKVAAFTTNYSSSPLVIVEREGEEVFGTAVVVRHKTLALARRHSVTQIVTNRLPSVPVILADSQERCFELVANRKADATIVNLFVASQYLNSHPQLRLAISGVLTKPEIPLRMAVHRDTDAAIAVAILNKGLASVTQQELDQIFAQHLLFGLESRQRVGLLQKRAKQILVIIALLAAMLMSWNYLMRREIRARRKVEAELREANQSMQIFSHSLSHDLRAPLRGMTGLANILKEDYREKLEPEGQDCLDHIISAGGHMDKLIADVLAYSRTTSSEWPIQTVELEPLAQQMIQNFPHDQRQCFEVASKLPAVRGHPTLLAQCLGNLFSNALQYVPRDRTPHIVIRATRDHSTVTVFVEDNGIGIQPTDQKRVFEMFERAAPSQYKGTGVGLAIVAKAVERMGGTVGVESVPGEGSRFWIRLPAAGAQHLVPPTERSHPFCIALRW